MAAEESMVASQRGLSPPPQQEAQAPGQEEWFANLEKPMDWRRRGFLNDAEFEAVKARMGLSPGQ